MEILQGFASILEPLDSSVVTIGNYDGVHLGHQELLRAVVNEAKSYGLPSVVVTFDPHPVKVLYPERKTERLFDLADQQEQFAFWGINKVVLQRFDQVFAQISPEDFLKKYLFEKLKPKTIVVGHDFAFGSQRTGNLEFLERHCAQAGIKLIIIPPFRWEGAPVSSTRIRQALKTGDLVEVEKLLGRPYYLRGQVEKGFQRGRTIGVPTANLTPDVEFVPRLGVYFTQTQLNQKTYASITNIGVNPTVTAPGEEKLKIETHLFDFNAQIYGLEMHVTLLKFWRDERKFASFDELKDQIQKDLSSAHDYFNGRQR